MYVKFLTEDGASRYDPSFRYPLPTESAPGEWIEAPGERPTDSKACGPNRLHVCNQLAPKAGARWGVPYEAEIEDIVGVDPKGKTSCRRLRLLRRIPLDEIIHPGADLSEANLHGADLRKANLHNANLRETFLRGANLSGADLSWADLRGADLRNAHLYYANLSNTDLTDADFSRANLDSANLSGTNLHGANFYEADLTDADLDGAKNANFLYAKL